MANTKVEITPPTVIIFKVTLLDFKRKYWRRIAIRDNQTLHHLHKAIFLAFERFDEHLYSFYFPSRGKAEFKVWQELMIEYTHTSNYDSAMMDYSHPVVNTTKTKLSTLHLEPGDRYDYLFDFGDNWLHEVEVEQIDLPVTEKRYPHILEKEGYPSPPQYEYDERERDLGGR